MPKASNVASFVLRFTQELSRNPQNEPSVQWRGHIRYVQGNEENRFTNFADAITFIQRYLSQLTINSLKGEENMSQAKMFRESFKLWEQFASGYTNMMFQATDQFLKQSGAFKEQVDEAREKVLEAWTPFNFDNNQKQISETLQEIQTQIETLSARVEALEKKFEDTE